MSDDEHGSIEIDQDTEQSGGDIQSNEQATKKQITTDLRRRSRLFTITDFVRTREVLSEILQREGGLTYLCIGNERCTTTGRAHCQAMVYFKNARTFSAMRKLLPQTHIEIGLGTVDQAAEYCKKDGDYIEVGTKPLSNVSKGTKETNRWTDVITLAKSGDLDAIAEYAPDIYMRYYSTCKRIASDNLAIMDRLEFLDNYWYYGKPGTGKSYQARDRYPEHYLKNANKWWCGYNGEDTVIIDEVELDHGKFIGHFLKIWADIYPFMGEVKGGGKRIRPKRIVITSNYSIDQVFAHDDMLRLAIRRRFQGIEFNFPYMRIND